jgi:hypothetical protein
LENLAKIAKSEPQAAYAAYIHGFQHKFRYFLRTIEGIEEELKPLDAVINNILIPSITGFQLSDAERNLFSLPVRLGGMGFDSMSSIASNEFEYSRELTAPLTALIILQGETLPDTETVKNKKNSINKQKQVKLKQRSSDIHTSIPQNLKRNVEQACEQGASSWLNVLPLARHGFTLSKPEFQDALALRYDKHISNLPSFCSCGAKFDVTHAMNCKRGGFINARHDNIRDFEASLLSQVCHDVETEPQLDPVTRNFFPRSANTSADARLDIRSRGFWRRGQNAFFDVRVTNADCASQSNLPIRSVLKKHESEKKRAYNERVMEVEQGTFTPLVFTVSGCMGPECTLFHKSLAEKISTKSGEKYSDVISFIRCKLSFMCVKSALLCLRGSISVSKKVLEAGNDFGLFNQDLHLNT